MRFLIVVALVALLEPATAKLELHLRPGQPLSVGSGDLVVTDLNEGTEKLRQAVEVPWHGELVLERPFSALHLEIDSPTLWSAPLVVSDLKPEETLTISTFQRGELIFSEENSEESTSSPKQTASQPETIAVEIASVPSPGKQDLLKKTRLACRLENSRWRCPAPALSLDLRLEKLRHVPHYVFGVKVEAGKSLDLGRIRFAQGASISGFVSVEEGEPKGATISVEASGTWSPREGHRQELRLLQAIANERGFFQIWGVAPGGYRLQATRKGLATTELWPVEVLDEKETALAQPIFLTRNAELEVRVSPPLGPVGKPWKLLLMRQAADASGSDEVLEENADTNGTWIWQDLSPGTYLLLVCNPDGEKTGAGADSIWASQFLDLLPGNQTIHQDISLIRVEGTMMAADEPVQGRLIFGGFNGSPHAVLWSDEAGQFAGQLPRAGDWDLDVEINGQLLSLEKVKVEPRGGRPARLEIRLPKTRFHGRVTHKGKPIEGASLWGRSIEPGNFLRFDTSTNRDGIFDLRGLASGAYEVTASSARLRLSAPRFQIDIRDNGDGGDDDAVEIELEAYQRIEGQILSNGMPVPLAPFGVFFRSIQGEDIQQGQGDSAGVLRVVVPESTREIALVVAAAGFAWQVLPLRPRLGTNEFAPFIAEVAQNGGTLRIESPEPTKTRIFSSGIEVPLPLVTRILRATGNAEVLGNQWLLTNASPGHYSICCGNHCAEGILAPAGSLEIIVPTGEEGVIAQP